MAIGRLHNQLTTLGIEVVTTDEENVHVSGHPARDELVQMYHWIRPDIAIPVHGEPRHLTAHAKLAKECQVPEALTALNGSLVRLAPGRAEVIDEVFVGCLALDGNLLIDLDIPAIPALRRLIPH